MTPSQLSPPVSPPCSPAAEEEDTAPAAPPAGAERPKTPPSGLLAGVLTNAEDTTLAFENCSVVYEPVMRSCTRIVVESVASAFKGDLLSPTSAAHAGSTDAQAPAAPSVGEVQDEESVTLLQGVSGAVSSGQIMAIMGPSGAGKTTLLNLLTGQNGRARLKRTARVTLNGQPLTADLLQSHAACVAQDDKLWTFLTARDHLRMAVECYQAGLRPAQRANLVESLLSVTGLASCQDVRTGTDDLVENVTSGLSGGQRRRLSLAVALAKRPAVLVADEPTTGLDDAAAAAIMSLLGELARATRMAVVCTIHQPSASVYAGIDKLLLLTRGTTAYYGPAAELSAFLASIGKGVPPGVSLTEHALDLVNADFVSEEEVEKVLAAWRKREALQPFTPPVPSPLPPSAQRASFGVQLQVLLARHHALMLLDPRELIVRLLLCILTYTIIGVFFWNVLHVHDQLTAFKLTQYFMLTLGYSFVFSTITLQGFCFEKLRLRRELLEGMYGRGAYCIAKIYMCLFINLPYAALLNVLTYLFSAGIPWDSFAATFGIMYVLAVHYELYGQLLGYSFGMGIGSAILINIVQIDMFTSGYFVTENQMLWPMRAWMYINPVFYALPSWFRSVYDPMVFSGATPCNMSSLEGALTCPSGFYCEDELPTNCYGSTGPQVLSSLSVQYGGLDPDASYVEDWFGAFGIGIVLTSALWVLAIVVDSRNLRMCPAEPDAAGAPAPAPAKPPGTKPPSGVLAAQAKAPAAAATELASLFSPMETDGVTPQAPRDSRLDICNVSLHLPSSTGDEKPVPILQDVSASVSSGQVLAIMGPSGAGKTTLLSLISRESKFDGSETKAGMVKLNGRSLTPQLYLAHVANVEQADHLWDVFTCREHLSVAVCLHHGGNLSRAECMRAVDSLLTATGLASCENVSAYHLSGGQRRRLSLAVALAKRPAVLVADEPTTGLDDAAAAANMSLLGELARATRMAVVCTIHQPSASVYAGIDKLLLLTRGTTAYYGPAAELSAFLASIGKGVPPGVSLTEHALDLVNADFVSEEEVEKVLAAWRKREMATTVAKADLLALPVSPRHPFIAYQAYILTVRSITSIVRDPRWLWNRMVMSFMMSLLYALVLLPARFQQQINAVHLLLSCYMLVSGISTLHVPLMHAYTATWPYQLRELKADMYHAAALAVANCVGQIIVATLCALALLAPGFLVLDWSGTAFWEGWLCLGIFLVSLDFLIEFLAYDPFHVSSFYMSQISVLCTVASGFFVANSEIYPGLNLVYDVNPIHWTLVNLINVVFLNQDRELGGSHVATNQTIPGIIAIARGSEYWCDDWRVDITGVACYGPTFRDALEGLEPRFEVIDPNLYFWEPIGWMLLICATIKLLAWFRLFLHYRRIRTSVALSVDNDHTVIEDKTEATSLLVGSDGAATSTTATATVQSYGGV